MLTEAYPFKRCTRTLWNTSLDLPGALLNMGLLINNQEDPRPPSNTDTSNTRWETVGEIEGGLKFTVYNLLILSNWLPPRLKSEPLLPPPWILTVILPWEAHQRPLSLFLWGEFHTAGPIFLVTGVWWLKCIEKGVAPLKGNDLVSCRPSSDGATSSSPHRRVVMKMKQGSRWCWGVEVMGSRVEKDLDVSIE